MHFNPKTHSRPITHTSAATDIVAKIGENGLEWDTAFNHAIHSVEADPTSTARMEAMDAIRRVEALNALEHEMSRKHIAIDEQAILSKIAARRGFGSLHSDLGLG